MNIWVKILHIFRVVKWLMIRHVWWYGCLHRFTIGNPKYLEDLGCPCGPNPPPLGSNG